METRQTSLTERTSQVPAYLTAKTKVRYSQRYLKFDGNLKFLCLGYGNRYRMQQLQQEDWIKQQMREKQLAKQNWREADLAADRLGNSNSEILRQTQEHHANQRRAMLIAVQETNA